MIAVSKQNRLDIIARHKVEDAPTHCALEKARRCWCTLISPREHLDVLVLVLRKEVAIEQATITHYAPEKA